MLKINKNLVSRKNNVKTQKYLSFGMNPINQPKKILNNANVYLSSNIPRLSRNVQNNINCSNNIDSLNLSQNNSNIELVEVIIEQSQNNDKQQHQTLDQIYSKKDKLADDYFDKKAGTCSKIGACIPFIGGFFVGNLIRKRSKELDSIYGVPQYLDSSQAKTWPHNILNLIALLHLTFIGSIIATPLAICTINCLDNIQKQNIKKVYREIAEKEKATKKQETKDETTLRHAEKEADYWKKVAKSDISTIKNALYY